MTDIKPIQTNYKGYLFRSRLEARWALFFDEMCIKYEYEPEGFTLSNGDSYLPDFYLPESDTYLEVKAIGAINMVQLDQGVDFHDGREQSAKYAWFTYDIVKTNNYIVVIGDPVDAFHIDKTNPGQTKIFFESECLYKGYDHAQKCKNCDRKEIACYTLLGFVNNKPFICTRYDEIPFIPIRQTITIGFITKENEMLPVDCEEDDIKRDFQKMIRSATIARQARFEHGERR